MKIRLADFQDRAELSRLMHALFPDNDDDLDGEVADYLSAPREKAAMFVAERANGGLAGFVEVGTRPYAEGCMSSPVPYVEAWFVDEDVRRQGIGGQLFEAVEDWARRLGFTEIASDALIENEVSHAAHRALGYEEVERIVCFRKPL